MQVDRTARLIQRATVEVFSTMLGTELTPQPVFCDPTPLQQSEVTGLMGFAGAVGGYVSIHCTREQAREFTARLLGMDAAEVDSIDDVRDAVGELVNIIAGSLKRELGSSGPIELAMPTVVMSPKPDIRVRARLGVVVPFEDPSGTFHVELVLEPTGSAGSSI